MNQLTSFLEKMDQSAGEIVGQASPTPAPGPEEEEEHSEGEGLGDATSLPPSTSEATAEGTTTATASSGPLSQQPSPMPSGPTAKGGSTSAESSASAAAAVDSRTLLLQKQKEKIIALQRKADGLQRANAQLEQKYEQQSTDRDTRFNALQKDYDACMVRLREMQNTTSDLKQQLVEAKTMAQSAQQKEGTTQERLSELQHRFELAKDSVVSLEAQLGESQSVVQTLSQEKEVLELNCGKQSQQTETLKAELSDYKAKAQLLLHEKERQIETLQRSNLSSTAPGELRGSGEENVPDSRNTEVQLQSQLETASSQLKEIQAEKDTLRDQLDNAHTTVVQLEKKFSGSKTAEAEAQYKAKASHGLFEGEVEAHQATKKHFVRLVAEKDEEIAKLKRGSAALAGPRLTVVPPPLSATTDNNSGSDSLSGVTGTERTAGGEAVSSQDLADLERRAKDLAELVREKQAALESKRSEAEQWRTRCELTQQRLREAEMMAHSVVGGPSASSGPSLGPGGHRSVLIDDERDIQDSLHGDFSRSKFFGGLQRRGPWGQRVVGVAQTLDSVSLKTGTLLKRNSVLRVALIAYVILLHVWVFIVLSMSSTSGPCDGVGTSSTGGISGSATGGVVEPKVR